MNPKLKLSKLDCARRQLEMAIELYFMERDPVSIHTLAKAVYQLLMDINKHRGGKPLFTEVEALKGIIIPGKEEIAAKMFRDIGNFFKHADHDPENTMDFYPRINELVLWEARAKYYELTGEKTPAMQAMNAWFQIHHADLFNCEEWRKNKLKEVGLWATSISKSQFYKSFINSTFLHD